LRLADNCHVGLGVDHQLDSLPHHRVVVENQDAAWARCGAFMRLPYSLAMDIGTRAKYRHRVSIELIPEYISLSELYLLKNHLIVN
jgi:hypothetical protein